VDKKRTKLVIYLAIPFQNPRLIAKSVRVCKPLCVGSTPTCASIHFNRSQLAYSFADLSLSALAITETELKLIAAAAIIGLSRSPKNGYRTPAATGTPTML
jgi:hypothetical protein